MEQGEERSLKRFVQVFFLVACGLALAMAAFNYRMNPYGLFDAFPLSLKNSNRSAAVFDVMRQTKAYDAIRYRPDFLILGSSRSGYGLKDAGPLVQRAKGLRLYNNSMPGMTPYEMLRYLQHVGSASQLRGALLGLDFFSFNVHYRKFQPGFDERRLFGGEDQGAGTFGLWSRWLNDAVIALFSHGAYQNSMRALDDTAAVTKPVVNSDGSWGDELAARQSNRWTEIFRKTELIYIGQHWFGHESRRFALYGRESRLAMFEQMLRYAHEHNIALTAFISPMHARMHVLLDKLGLYRCFEQWKRELLAINLRVAQEYRRRPFALWDFSYVSGLSSEVIRDRVKPVWFTDSTHYDPKTGERMVRRMLLGEADSFGVKHSESGALDAWLQQQYAQLRAYRDGHQEQERELDGLIRSVWGDAIPPITPCSDRSSS